MADKILKKKEKYFKISEDTLYDLQNFLIMVNNDFSFVDCYKLSNEEKDHIIEGMQTLSLVLLMLHHEFEVLK